MKKANFSLVIALKSDHLNQVIHLCDYRFNMIIQGQENERKRSLQSHMNKQETKEVRDAQGRDGTASSEIPTEWLRDLGDLTSSVWERELTTSR